MENSLRAGYGTLIEINSAINFQGQKLSDVSKTIASCLTLRETENRNFIFDGKNPESIALALLFMKTYLETAVEALTKEETLNVSCSQADRDLFYHRRHRSR